MSRRPRALACALLALVVPGACRGAPAGRHERTVAIAACADAIERAGAAAPGTQVAEVARGCASACIGLADWAASRDADELRPGVARTGATHPRALEALLDGCVPGCDPHAGDEAAVGARWPTLIGACGGEALAIPRDEPSLASEEWLALAQVARWLDRATRAGVDDGQVPTRLEHVTEAATFVLPLPAVPGTPTSRYASMPRARQFVLVGGPELRTGALPQVRLRGGRLEVAGVPGGFPGQAVDLERLPAVFAQHTRLLAGAAPAPTPDDGPPLVLAEEHVPVATLVDLITRLGVPTAAIAVAGDVTLAHPVLLERRGSAFAAPELHLARDAVQIRGFGDDRTTDWAHLPAELDHFTAVNAPVRSLDLVVAADVTVTDLARALDACVDARVSTLLFAPATTSR